MELASTLIIFVATPNIAAALQIGDGAILLATREAGIELLTEPRHGLFANETYFLTDDDWAEQVQQVAVERHVLGALCITDGLEHLALTSTATEASTIRLAPFLPFVEPVLRMAGDSKGSEHMRGFLESPRLRQQTDDDCTIAAAVRRE